MKLLTGVQLRIFLVLLFCVVIQSGWAQQRKAALPYRVVANKMIVDVEINGVVCPLIFDTGGTMGIIDRVCDELELEGEGHIEITDVTGENTIFPKMHVRELRIPDGDMVFPDISVMRMTISSPIERFGAVGLLGSDLWGHSIIHIDHQKQVVTVTSAEEPVALDEKYRIPFTDDNGIWPIMTVGVGDRSIKMMFDSGAHGFMSLKETDYRDLYSWNMTQVLDRGFGSGPSGVGGRSIPRVETKRIRLAPVKVGAAILNGVITDELTAARNTLLGIQMLKYGKVTIDYSRRQFYFVPYHEESDVEQELYNIAFAVKDNELVVNTVWGDLRKTVKLGDKVVKINGKDTKEFDLLGLLINGIPQVTGKRENELIIMTKEGEKKVVYKRMKYD